jgi:hypothetical protein
MSDAIDAIAPWTMVGFEVTPCSLSRSTRPMKGARRR